MDLPISDSNKIQSCYYCCAYYYANNETHVIIFTIKTSSSPSKHQFQHQTGIVLFHCMHQRVISFTNSRTTITTNLSLCLPKFTLRHFSFVHTNTITKQPFPEYFYFFREQKYRTSQSAFSISACLQATSMCICMKRRMSYPTGTTLLSGQMQCTMHSS